MASETAHSIIENNILRAEKLPPLPIDKHLNKILLQNLRNNPDFVGLIDARTGETCTYKKLTNDSIRCALWLKKQGIGPGDIVALCSHHNIAAWVPFCATLFVGANLNIWYDQWSAEVSRHFVKLIKPKIIFANEQAGGILKQVFEAENVQTKIIIFGKMPGLDSFDDIIRQGTSEEIEKFQCYPVKSNDDALLLFSSGSSGFPKGVQHSYRGVLYNSYRYNSLILPTGNRISTFTSPLYWISSVFNVLRSLIFLCPLVILNDPTPEEFCKAVEKYKIRWIGLGTGFLNELFMSGLLDKYDFSSIAVIGVGGAKVRTEILKKVTSVLKNGDILQGYGITELGGMAALQRKGLDNYDSCGRLTYDVEMKIIDPNTKKILGPNGEGEICFKQTYIMKHYFRNPEATKDMIDEDGWLHTGDLGFYDEEGNIFVIDRIKELIKYKGHHISPCEIENILVQHPEVLDAAVIGVPHSVDVEHTLAFVIALKNSEALKQELLIMASVLGETKRLHEIVFIETLPKTGTRKIKRSELKKMSKDYTKM